MDGMLYVADELRKQLLKAQRALIKIAQADDLEEAKDWANGAIQAHEEWRESMRWGLLRIGGIICKNVNWVRF